MNVLMISYFFPPYGGGAVSRVHSFVKYFPELGINPYVLSVKPEYYSFEPHYLDENLQSQYSNSVKIFRSEIFLRCLYPHLKSDLVRNQSLKENKTTQTKDLIKKLLKFILIPDAKILYWVPEANKLGKDILVNNQIDLIFATVPPYSSHILGYHLSRRHKKPLVLDFRDLYSSYLFHQKNQFKQHIAELLERRSIAQSKKVIVTNKQAKEYLIELHSLPNEKVKVIQNGFDEDFLDQVINEKRNDDINKFIISYIGSLKILRTPQYFLEAIKCFSEINPGFPIQVQLVGLIDHCHKELINKLELSSIVIIIENVSQKKALEYMVNSNLLLLLQRQSDGGKTAIPGKVYEYLATGIPVLTIDEGGGATTKFLNSLGLSSIKNYTDPQAILSGIERIITDYKALVEKHQQIQKTMDQYSRRHEAEKLATALRNIINKNIQSK